MELMARARRMSLCVAFVALVANAQGLYAGEVAYDGSGRLLTVSDAGAQIRGQILNVDGTPVTGIIEYTTGPSRKALAHVRYGGGRYLIAYTNVYSAGDTDVEGILIRPDGTVDKNFHIDFTGFHDDPNGIVYVAERNEFYVVYVRLFSSPYNNELRGVYVTPSGVVGTTSRLALDVRYGAPGSTSLAAGPGNIMVLFLDNAGNVRRGHVVPGQNAFQESVFVANAPGILGVGNGRSTAYNAALSRFILTYADTGYSSTASIFAQTLPLSCFTSNCAGLSPQNLALSTTEAGSSGLAGHTVAAAGNNFVIAAGTRWPDRSGVISASVGASGWAHTKHLGPWATPCTENSHFIVEAASLGTNALFVMAPPCYPTHTRHGLTLNTWSGRTSMPFAIPVGK